MSMRNWLSAPAPRRHRVTCLLLVACALVAGPAHAARPQVDDYGTLADGRRVAQITLRNATGMTVRVLTLGGIISEISTRDRAGQMANVVLAKPDLAAYAAGNSFSSLIGRFANRISGSGFTLDGKRHDLVGANAAGIVIHGGPKSYSQQVWTAAPFGGARGPSGVVLGHHDPDGTNGFPGNVEVSVRYTLSDDDTLRLDYRATTDQPTVVNLTHHVYFNLTGATLPTSADDQCLQIFADRYGETQAQVMTGRLLDVSGTPLDMRRPTRLGDRINRGYDLLPRGFDTPFVLRKRGAALVPAVRAWDPATGRMMEVRTNEVSVQVYTPPIRPASSTGGAATASGTPSVPIHAAGYALETEHLPQSPNYPEFPTTVLRPGQILRSATSFHFGTFDPATNVCPRAARG